MKGKRLLSLTMSGVMTASMLPVYLTQISIPAAADDWSIIGAIAGRTDDTDLTIDFDYAENNNVQSPDDAMRQLGDELVDSYLVNKSDWKTNYNKYRWNHPTMLSVCGTDYVKGTGTAADLRYLLEDDHGKNEMVYVALPTDIHLERWDNSKIDWESSGGAFGLPTEKVDNCWAPIRITSNTVLDLNGHSIQIDYFGNINHNSDRPEQEYTWPESHYLTAFEINNGATLTIIDSSQWRGEGVDHNGTGNISFNAGEVNHYDYALRWYDHRDLFHVENGNLVIYGGTYTAGLNRMLRVDESKFSWEKLKKCIGTAVELGVNITKYATGITEAEAMYKDVLQGIEKDDGEKPISAAAPSGKETTKDVPSGSSGRNQTIAEKSAKNDADIAKGKHGTADNGENSADADGKAKNDKNTRVAKAQNEIVNKVVNSDSIMGMVNSGFTLVDTIADMVGTESKPRLTNAIQGTVVQVGAGSTFAAYGGHFIGHGSTPNIRNAVVEVNWQKDSMTWDKSKHTGGLVYIYGGDFEANSGANVFNMYRGSGESTVTQYIKAYTPGRAGTTGRIEPVTVRITKDENYGVEQLFYENQDLLDAAQYSDGKWVNSKDEEVVPEPIHTANVQVRGGRFHCNYDVKNMAKKESYNESPDSTEYGDHFTAFPGTPGSVNLGVDSFGEDLIRDGRIQIVDNANGCLVLLDDDEEGYYGLHHYRLFCGDNELRTKDYLIVSPNEAQTNSSFSMQLAHYGGTGRDSKDLYKNDKDNIRATYRQMENYFDYEINGENAENYAIKPNFHYAGYSTFDTKGNEKKVAAQMDVYGEKLANSEVWYYPEPLDFNGNPIQNPGYGDAIGGGKVSYQNNEGVFGRIFDRDATQEEWDKKMTLHQDSLNYNVWYEGRKKIRTNMKYFTYKVYKVDPLTRENLPANPNTLFGTDDPLITVRYGASTDDALRCKIPLVDIAERIRSTRKELNWTNYQPGEMYRIVLEVEERVGAGYEPTSLEREYSVGNDQHCTTTLGRNVELHDHTWGQNIGTAKTTTSILFRCYQSSEQSEGVRRYNDTDFTPAQWTYNAYDKSIAAELLPLADDATDKEKADWARRKAAIEANNAIAAGEEAQINLINAKTGMTDFEGDVQVFDIYYQWWEVEEDGTPVRLLAGTDNVFDDGLDKRTEFGNKKDYYKYMENRIAEQKAASSTDDDEIYDLEDKTKHRPKGWNFNYVKKDGKPFQYCNTVDPNDPNAEYMDTNGLPKRSKDGNWSWTAEQIHLYSSETTVGREELTRWKGNLTLTNNNVFAFNTDKCYIPRELAGKYIQVKAIALNVRWPVAYDKKQTFYSHVVKVIDPSGELKASPYVEYDGDMNYATYDHPAKLFFGLGNRLKRVKDGQTVSLLDRISFNLDEGEAITSITYRANGKEKTFDDLQLTDPKKQPAVLYPNDFYAAGTNLRNLNAQEVDVQVQVTTSKGKVFWRRSAMSAPKKVNYEVEAEAVNRCGDETQTFRQADIQSGKYDSKLIVTDLYSEAGVRVFDVTPPNASVGFDYTQYTNTNPMIGTLSPAGYFVFTGETGETTVTVKSPDGKDVSKTIRVVKDIDKFEVSGVKAPVLGEKLDFTSVRVPADAPYHLAAVKWYRFGNEVRDTEIAANNAQYSIEITLAANEFSNLPGSGSAAPYSMTVIQETGLSETVTGSADLDWTDGEYVRVIYYRFPAKVNHEAKIVDEIYMNFPTEVREGDNFLKWLEDVEIYTNGYNEGFTFDITPTYGADAEKIAGAYGYSTDTSYGHQLNYFLKGVQTGVAAEIRIPNELKQLGDVFAEHVTLYVNGEKSTNQLQFGSDHIRIAAPDSLTVIPGDMTLPVKPQYSMKNTNAVVGQTIDLKDLLVTDDPRVNVVMTGVDFFKDEDQWKDYFAYDMEAGTIIPLKAGQFKQASNSNYLHVDYKIVFDADGDGYPEYQDGKHRISFGRFYASADDVPEVGTPEVKEPVKVRITVLDPDGKTASEGEYSYDFVKSVIQIPENTFITGIFDANGKRTGENAFKNGESYTVKTVSADSIEIYSGADSVYAFIKDADGKNLENLQISADNAHFTLADSITDLKPDNAYTLYYKLGIDGKLYTKDFRTAKQDYGVYIGRQPVTDADLGSLETDGWHYDPDTKTLTLKNFTLKDSGTIAKISDLAGIPVYSYATIYSPDDLTVNLIGENTVENLGDGLGDAVIWSDKNLTVTGNGSLNMAARGSSFGSYDLYSETGDINLNSSGTLAMEDTMIGFCAPKGSINYKNGTIDFIPETNTIGDTTYPIGGLLSSTQKDGIQFDDKVHDLEITKGKEADSMEKVTESEFATAEGSYTRIVPVHHATEKVVSAENHASGSCDSGATYHLSCECGHIGEETFQMPAEEHSLIKHPAKDATCEKPGSPVYWECEFCGERYADADGTKPLADADMVIAPLGHTLVHKEASKATCTEDGVSEHWACTRCGARFADKDGITPLDAETAVTPAAGHDWIHYFAKSPTCEKDGCIEHWKCANCGKYSADKEGTNLLTADEVKIKAAGHAWGEWTVVREAAEGVEGEEIRVCSHCDETEKRVIPAKQPAVTTTTKPVTTTAKIVTTTAKPVTTTAKIVTTTAKPVTTTAKIVTTTAKPVTTTAKIVTTTAKPVTTTAKIVTTTAKPVTTTAKIVTTTAKPVTTTAKIVTTTAKPVTTTAKIVTTTAKPVTTTAKIVTTTEKPVTTTEKPVTTTEKETTTTAEITTTVITSDSGTDTTPAQTTTTAPPEPEPLKGDVDGSDNVSIEDVQLALKAYTMRVSGKDHGLTEKQVKAADVNEDGELSVDDVQNILIYYVNNTVAGKKLTWEQLLGKQPQPRPELLTLHEDIWIGADRYLTEAETS